MQFGFASGMHGALRSAIGATDPNTGQWSKAKPKREDYTASDEPHARGAVLVSAVFAAFVTIYRARSADLIRLATNGTGVLPAGEISHDLAGRLAGEAAKVADQVLNMCIRALDYCPPVDVTFGDYLRAIITADRDLVPLDDRGYRVAFISAFRDRGIFPTNVAHLAEDSLVVGDAAAFGRSSEGSQPSGRDPQSAMELELGPTEPPTAARVQMPRSSATGSPSPRSKRCSGPWASSRQARIPSLSRA